MSDHNHLPECPAGRDRYHLCICETLRLIRAAARSDDKVREDERREPNARP